METKIIPKRIRNKVLKILLDLDNRMKMDQCMSFADIHHGICAIVELQKDYVRRPVARAANMSKLIEWAKEYDVDCSCVAIAQYDDFGFGLEATRDVKKGQKFLEIPLKLIFSQKPFLMTDFGKMIKALNLMPGVSLALALLTEMYKEDSFWKPYMDILPSEYNMLLYFKPEEMELLCDTTLQSQALKFYQIALSQYLQIYKMMEGEIDKKKLWPMKNFCFDDFRWALCTALTRQNTIENASGAKEFVLIPLWDMCNHTWGEVSTSFIYSSETIISEAMKDFKTGEQILIHYGDRSLSEMFLYGGYIIPNAPTSLLAVKIQLSSKDPASALKIEALRYLGLQTPYLLKMGCNLKPKCLAFVRIFCMSKELLIRFLDNPGDLNLLEEQCLWVSLRHEIEVWRFLLGRCILTERSYRNTLEQDLQSLSNCSSGNLQEIYKLRVEEKKILKRFYTFCQLQVNFLEECVHDFAAAETIYGKTISDHGPYPFICVGPHCVNGNGIYRCHHIDFKGKVNSKVADSNTIHYCNLLPEAAGNKNLCNKIEKVFGETLSMESDVAKETNVMPNLEYHKVCSAVILLCLVDVVCLCKSIISNEFVAFIAAKTTQKDIWIAYVL